MLAKFGGKHLGIPLISVIGVLFIIATLTTRVVTGAAVELSLPNKLQDFITLSLSVMIEALPFILLGLFISIAVQIWLPKHVLFKILPRNTVLRRIILSFLGIFLPVCECGNVPLARGFMIKGLGVGDSLTFLLAAPILNPVTIITTHQAFGGDMTILAWRLAGGFIIANLVGWIFSGKDSHAVLTDDFQATCKTEHGHSKTQSKFQESTRIFRNESNVIAPALFMGSFIAGFIQVALPREVLTSLGGHVVLSILAMMALAFIISICANVDAFFALAFANTFTTGSLVAFLVFGPIVDIKMLALLKTTYRVKVLGTIILVTTLVSGTIGLAVNYAF